MSDTKDKNDFNDFKDFKDFKEQRELKELSDLPDQVMYNVTIVGRKFDEFNADNFINCTFEECIFADKPSVNIQVQKLLQTQTLVNCWYNPVNVFANILSTLHNNVNIVDALNKAWVKLDSKKNQVTNKQLILLDIKNENTRVKGE